MAGTKTTLATMTAQAMLDQDFLFLRAKILEAAAVLDRIDRGTGDVDSDSRIEKVLKAIDAVRNGNGDRAEQVQLIFSHKYNADWRAEFGV